MSQKAIARLFDEADKNFFAARLLRKAHIRQPHAGECEREFRSLGDHNRARRRILLCRVDARGAFLPDGKIMKIPFLAFADETIEDNDETLVPIVQEVMWDALGTGGRA